jgi:outer membrane protein OmpA-like peptidoglycan-associated protein/ABC-type nitrate/sulfonate/bicarbonate transport system substrate-binding protein
MLPRFFAAAIRAIDRTGPIVFRIGPMKELTGTSKVLIAVILLGSAGAALYTRRDQVRDFIAGVRPASSPSNQTAVVPTSSGAASAVPSGKRPMTVVINQWPGLMPLVVGAGGLTTQPGSAAAEEGLDLKFVFVEDAPTKNKMLREGTADAVWQTVDELPMAMGGFKAAGVDVRTFIQIDWSRGGDACVASKEVTTVEDLLGRKTATLLLSPDHTLFEFMITNSRLTPEQVTRVRRDVSFSADDPTFSRIQFGEKKVDVACLWEPDVTLALEARSGSHRLFSTSDATELIADILVTRREFLDLHSDLAAKFVRTWFAGVRKVQQDRPAAARLISTVCPRFRDEMGYDKTLRSFDWVKLSDLTDNVRMFGLDGQPPAFDRVYNQAESIWLEYPQAQIKDRFVPSALRDDRVVRRIWEAEGRKLAARDTNFRPSVAATGSPLFTKPVSISFRSNKSELTTESISVVNRRVLPQLQIAGGMYIRVEGNTDNVGDSGFNQQLSEKRAKAIVDYLVTKGVDLSRVVAKGNGPTKPIASNNTPEGRARNRRTDILFIPAPPAS